MKKWIVVLILLCLVALPITGCLNEHPVVEPILNDDSILSDEPEDSEEATVINETIADTIIESLSDTFSNQNTAQVLNVTERLQPREIDTSPVSPAQSVTPPVPAPFITSNPTTTTETTQSFDVSHNVSTTQNPVTDSTPTQTPTMPQQTPESESVSTPQPTPTQISEPSLEPIQTHDPPVQDPPQARTICNTCGEDITNNVPAHGTQHLIYDEDFSYRVE